MCDKKPFLNIRIKKEDLAYYSLWVITFFLVILISFNLGVEHQKSKVYYLDYTWLKEIINHLKVLPNRVSFDNLIIKSNSITLVGDYEVGEFSNTKSMLPILDYGSKGIYIRANPNTEISIGDIISYTSQEYGVNIAHRVININYDLEGKYYITKGDSVKRVDPYKVRPEEVNRILIGALW